MKKILIVSLVLLTYLSTQAQSRFSIGLRAGVSVSKITGKFSSGEKMHNKFVTGGHGGLMLDVPVAGTLTIQTGAMLAQKGSNLKNYEYMGEVWNGELRALYLEVPLNLIIKPADGKFMIGAGPYIAFGIGGEAELYDDKMQIDKYDNDVSMSDLSDQPIIYRPTEAGANIFIGTRLGQKTSVQLNGQLGFSRINAKLNGQETGEASHKFKGLGLSLNYRLF